MNMTGRSYIFVAATLLILAASLKVLDDYVDTDDGQLRMHALKVAVCDRVSLEAANMRLGCHSNLVSHSSRPQLIRADGGTVKLGQ